MVVASVHDTKKVVCSRKVVLVADVLLSECAHEKFDLIALPGGLPGANHLRDSDTLKVQCAAGSVSLCMSFFGCSLSFSFCQDMLVEQ